MKRTETHQKSPEDETIQNLFPIPYSLFTPPGWDKMSWLHHSIIDKSAIGEPQASGNLSPLRGRQPVAQHEAAIAAECWVIHKKNQNPERSERVAACHGVGRKPGDGRHQLRIVAKTSAAHSLRRGSYKILRLPRVPPQ